VSKYKKNFGRGFTNEDVVMRLPDAFKRQKFKFNCGSKTTKNWTKQHSRNHSNDNSSRRDSVIKNPLSNGFKKRIFQCQELADDNSSKLNSDNLGMSSVMDYYNPTYLKELKNENSSYI
jgi:hypothetical protein